MRVYVGERTADGPRVWVVEERPRPSAAEVAQVLRELNEASGARTLGDGEFDAERRRVAIERKNDLVARLRRADEAPPARPLTPSTGARGALNWGPDAAATLAAEILQQELGVAPTAAVTRRFHDDIIDRFRGDRFRLPAGDVRTWVLDHREFVEDELFLASPEPPGPALAVTGPDAGPRTASPPPADHATASALVAACEAAWADIQRHRPEVPDAVVVLGTGVERGRLVKLGHWWSGRWLADGQVRGEVLLAGEALNLEPRQVFEVLLHEAAHGLNAARGVKDTSRGGRYHNQRYASAAQEVMLRVRPMPPYGLADTRLSDAALERYEPSIARLAAAMRIARQIQHGTTIGDRGAENGDSTGAGGRDGTTGRGKESGAAAVAACGCGRRLRMAPSVLAAGPVSCGLCGSEFAATAKRRNTPDKEAGKADGVVDQSFVARRRRAIDAAAVTEGVPKAGVHRPDTVRNVLDRRRARLAAAISVAPGPGHSAVGPLVDRHRRLVNLLGPAVMLVPSATTEQKSGIAELTAEPLSEPDRDVVSDWYQRFGGPDERPMAAADAPELARRLRLARSLLKADGTLVGPPVRTGTLELMAGDRVVSRAPGTTDGPPPGTLGTVEIVDPERGDVEIDFATWGRLRTRLASGLASALRHDYAELDDRKVPTGVDVRLDRDHLAPDLGP